MAAADLCPDGLPSPPATPLPLPVGCRGEVWTLDIDPSETRLATGSADGELRLYAITPGESPPSTLSPLWAWPRCCVQSAGAGSLRSRPGVSLRSAPPLASHSACAPSALLGFGTDWAPSGPCAARLRAADAGSDALRPMGSVRRVASDRAALLRYSAAPAGGVSGGGGLLLTCQSSGRATEVFKVRDEAEATRRLKRRRRRRREKAGKEAGKEAGKAAAAAAPEGAAPADEVRPLGAAGRQADCMCTQGGRPWGAWPGRLQRGSPRLT